MTAIAVLAVFFWALWCAAVINDTIAERAENRDIRRHERTMRALGGDRD